MAHQNGNEELPFADPAFKSLHDLSKRQKLQGVILGGLCCMITFGTVAVIVIELVMFAVHWKLANTATQIAIDYQDSHASTEIPPSILSVLHFLVSYGKFLRGITIACFVTELFALIFSVCTITVMMGISTIGMLVSFVVALCGHLNFFFQGLALFRHHLHLGDQVPHLQITLAFFVLCSLVLVTISTSRIRVNLQNKKSSSE